MCWMSPKPCIDMEDEGYNVEWSQELESPPVLRRIPAGLGTDPRLARQARLPGRRRRASCSISASATTSRGFTSRTCSGSWTRCRTARTTKPALVEQVAGFYPAVRDLDIPNRLSDNVTLSTMHGCPPEEIESISTYLLRERRLHTLVKCNPTLLGPGARARHC